MRQLIRIGKMTVGAWVRALLRGIRWATVRLPRIKRTQVLIALGGVVCLVTITLVLVRTCLPVTAHYNAADHSVEQPFAIRLNQALRDVPLREIKISPQIAGAWSLVDGGLIGDDTVVFTPASAFRVSTQYTIELPKAKRLLFGTAAIDAVHFSTEAAPKLDSTGMSAQKDGATIAADHVFGVNLTSKNRGLRAVELRTEPALTLEKKVIDDTRYIWRPIGLLPQGTKIVATVVDTKNNVTLLKRVLTVAEEPRVAAPVKSSYFTPSDKAIIQFSQAIAPESGSLISFDLDGTGAWQSDTTYVFTPRHIEPGRTYHYTIKSGLRSKQGGVFAADYAGSFSTTGAVQVVGTSPRGSGLAQASQQIKFTFDQGVDRTSVQERFSVSRGRVTGSSWHGNTYSVNVSDLGFGQTVTASVAAGVRPTGFGLPSTHAFSVSFTTEVRSVKLNVPLYRQQYRGSCAAASLRMALASRGIGSDDMSLIGAMGYSPRPADKSTDPMTWDDPDLMYVGDVNGSIRDGTGAGPDAPPVAKAARAFGAGASNVTGASPGWIAEQIYAGRPVIFFGAIANTGFISWQTSTGRVVTMNLTSHARVAYGVQGEPDNPLGFWVHDPLGGSSLWTTGKLAGNMSLDPYRQAVVIY